MRKKGISRGREGINMQIKWKIGNFWGRNTSVNNICSIGDES
jgi:hypothetical protein